MKKYLIGVDVGGTKTQAAVVTDQERIIARKRTPTGNETCGSVIDSIIEVIESLMDDLEISSEDVLGIGLGVAGMVDFKKGKVIFSPNLPLRDISISRLIEDRLSIPTFLDNDANMAVMGERAFGAAKGFDNVVGLTLGTGIGGGIFTDGRLMRGDTGSAAEIGHMVIDKDGEVCGCGNRGCLEALASGKAIERMATERIAAGTGSMIREVAGGTGPVTAAHVADAARQGDREAQEIFSIMAEYLGIGLVNMANIFDPQIIVLMGGLAKAHDLFLPKAEDIVRSRALPPCSATVKIDVTALGDDAALLGAIASLNRELKAKTQED